MSEFPKEEYDPEMYGKNFHNNVCHVCKRSENLSRCSQCKIMAYCSKEHQTADWKYHKKICSVYHKALLLTCTKKVKTFQDYIDIRKLRYSYISSTLGRELKMFEKQMLMFPRFCEFCYSENVDVQCPNCKNVWFCSQEHMDQFKVQHDKHCDELKFQFEYMHIFFNSKLRNCNLSLANIPADIKQLPNSLWEFIELVLSQKCFDRELNLQEKMFKRSSLHVGATLLYCLEKCGIVKNRVYPKSKITIHVVGANHYEFGQSWKLLSELILHWLMNVTRVEYCIIGPELPETDIVIDVSDEMCYNCIKRHLRAKCSFHREFYYNRVRYLNKPDVILCLNGLNLESTSVITSSERVCIKSVRCLVKQTNVPLIISCPVFKELVNDSNNIQKYTKKQLKVLIEPQKNPFCSGQPLRDSENQLEPVYYMNGYITAISS